MSPGHTVDLNADVGERSPGDDDDLLPLVTTVHIACGFHAGDAATMRHVVERAVDAGVAVGAHPSYPDRDGFGRREMDRSPDLVAADVVEQVEALAAIAGSCGARVVSVKPHGALYHRVATDPECASAVAAALAGIESGLAVVVPAGMASPDGGFSPSVALLRAAGLITRAEGFCDRGYHRDGSLVARSEAGALITDGDAAARQARSLVLDRVVDTVDGVRLTLEVDTLCVHGDTPGAASIAAAVRRSLESAGVRVAAPPPPTG